MVDAIDIDEEVSKLTDSEEFDVIAFARGAIRPKKDVTIFTDADAAVKLAELYEAEAAAAAKETDTFSLADEPFAIDEDELTELHQRLEDSKVIFHLEGLAPAARKAIENHLTATISQKDDPAAYFSALNNTIIAKTVVGVTRSGKRYPLSWTPEDSAAFEAETYEVEFGKLVTAAGVVTYIAQEFDSTVTPDFS